MVYKWHFKNQRTIDTDHHFIEYLYQGNLFIIGYSYSLHNNILMTPHSTYYIIINTTQLQDWKHLKYGDTELVVLNYLIK